MFITIFANVLAPDILKMKHVSQARKEAKMFFIGLLTNNLAFNLSNIHFHF